MRPSRAPWIGLVVASLIAGCVASGPIDDEAGRAAPEASYPGVRLETSKGDIVLLLYADRMPVTTKNFVDLVAAGFYNGTIFHRVIDDFVVQGGDPTGTGNGGSDETIPLETHDDLFFAAGCLGMAREPDPDTATSQFFVCEHAQPHLRDPDTAASRAFGRFAMFGQVVSGMEVVRDIADDATIPGADRPVTDVVLAEASLENVTLAPHELARLPVRTYGRAHSALFRTTLEVPLRLVAGTDVDARWTVEGEQHRRSPVPFSALDVRIEGPGDASTAVARATSEDPRVFAGPLAFPVAGRYTVSAGADPFGDLASFEVDVLRA
ncbi:MAG: peptidylprolyl isomerase [Methanobacteriota archaeon]